MPKAGYRSLTVKEEYYDSLKALYDKMQLQSQTKNLAEVLKKIRNIEK